MSRSSKASAFIAVLLAVVILTAPAVQAASWTTLMPADYISNIYYEGYNRCVKYDFKRTPFIAYTVGSYSSTSTNFTRISLLEGDTSATFNAYPLGAKAIPGPPLSNSASGQVAIDVSDFKPSAVMSVSSNLKVEFDISYYYWAEALDELFALSGDWYIYAYNASGSYVGTIERKQYSFTGALQDVPDQTTYVYDIPIDLDFTFSEFADTVRYIVPVFQLKFNIYDDDSELQVSYVYFSCDGYTITTRTDMLLKDSLTLEAIEDQVVDIGDKLDQTNDKLDDTNEKLDEIIELPQKEKEEASQEGNKFVDQLTGAIPSDNQGFLNAITELASSMSYEGTEAKLSIPAIDIPAIPGLFDGFRLMDKDEVDFGAVVQKIPEPIMTLVQVLCTLGLVVYSFKELYGMISYAMTLKGGKSDV